MCALVQGRETGGQVTNYRENVHCDLPPSSSLQLRFSEDLVPLPGSQPGSYQKWRLLEASSGHWNPNEPEPLTTSGTSPLLEFTERREGCFYCVVPLETGLCNYSNIKKGRMLSHIRKDHLNFRPFPCGGQCGLQGCPLRFPSSAALKEHTAPRKVTCGCGKVLYAQNLQGHQAKCASAKNPS